MGFRAKTSHTHASMNLKLMQKYMKDSVESKIFICEAVFPEFFKAEIFGGN